jgi:hydrogenase maturation protease
MSLIRIAIASTRCALAEPTTILVLGVGNLVRRDEGFGVHVIRHLSERFQTSPNVTLLDGGTAGVALLDAILACNHLIAIDAARQYATPGTLSRLDGEALSYVFKTKQSAHDWGLSEILLQARLLGHEPKVVIIAAEPQDMDSWSDELTPLLASRVPEAVAMTVAEVEAAGGVASCRFPHHGVNLPARRPCTTPPILGK